MSEQLLQDKVVLIVGAGREPGPSLALAFAALGAIVAVNDLSPVVLDPLVEAVQAQGGQAGSFVADATRGMPLRAMLDDVLERWGRIDLLVNNPRVQPNSPLMEMDEWDFQRTVEMNLNGPFLVTKLVAQLMREQGQGVILNILEDEARAVEAPGSAAYAASQAGLKALTRKAAQELIAYNIRVYGIQMDQGMPATREEGATTSMMSAGRALSQLAVFLCSDAAAGLPGQILQASAQGWADQGRVSPATTARSEAPEAGTHQEE